MTAKEKAEFTYKDILERRKLKEKIANDYIGKNMERSYNFSHNTKKGKSQYRVPHFLLKKQTF